MTNKITVSILTLTILAIFFIAGCAKTEIEPEAEEELTPEETVDKTVGELSQDISDIDIMDDDLDTQDLDNLAQDLNDLDW